MKRRKLFSVMKMGIEIKKIKIAESIRSIRRAQGFQSAWALSVALSQAGYYCSASIVKSWETGYRRPTLDAVAALCAVLGVTADALIFGVESKV